MGEKSKKSGEYGENVVKRLFALIGWTNMIEGEDITCHKNKLHAHKKDSERVTHGLDFIFNYESPLTVGKQECNIISSKYNDKYESVNSKFKDHLKDISYAMECFPYSEYYTTNVNTRIEVKNINGIIVWLSREDDFKKSLYEEVLNFRNSENLTYKPVMLIDNLRASFLYSIAIDLNKVGYQNASFIYQSTGSNITTIARKSDGSILPVESLTSSMQFIKVSNTNEEILMIYSLFSFDENALLRIIGLARDLTEQWASKIIIKFPNYDDFNHANSVRVAKSKYEERKLVDKISVKKFDIVTFRNLEGEND